MNSDSNKLKTFLEERKANLECLWSKLYTLSKLFSDERFLNAYTTDLMNDVNRMEESLKAFLKQMEDPCQK